MGLSCAADPKSFGHPDAYFAPHSCCPLLLCCLLSSLCSILHPLCVQEIRDSLFPVFALLGWLVACRVRAPFSGAAEPRPVLSVTRLVFPSHLEQGFEYINKFIFFLQAWCCFGSIPGRPQGFLWALLRNQPLSPLCKEDVVTAVLPPAH